MTAERAIAVDAEACSDFVFFAPDEEHIINIFPKARPVQYVLFIKINEGVGTVLYAPFRQGGLRYVVKVLGFCPFFRKDPTAPLEYACSAGAPYDICTVSEEE